MHIHRISLSVNVKIGFDLTKGENGMPALRIRDFEGKLEFICDSYDFLNLMSLTCVNFEIVIKGLSQCVNYIQFWVYIGTTIQLNVHEVCSKPSHEQ